MDTVELFSQAETALRDATRALRDLHAALEESDNTLATAASDEIDALRESCEEGVPLVTEHRTLVMGG